MLLVLVPKSCTFQLRERWQVEGINLAILRQSNRLPILSVGVGRLVVLPIKCVVATRRLMLMENSDVLELWSMVVDV